MPSLRLLSEDNELRIFNRQQKKSDEIFQAIHVLIKTYGPFDEMKHSLNEMLGKYSAGDDLIQDITVRMNNINDILKMYYGVQDMTIMDIYDEDGTGQTYSIDLFITYVDGSFEQGTVELEAA